MSEPPRYSRVYWSFLDDPRTAPFIEDLALVGAWVKLLVIAEMFWPTSAELPRWATRRIVKVLSQAGCIEVSAGRFRFHGLDAERGRRSDAGRVGGVASGVSRRTIVERPLNDRSRIVPVMNERPLNDRSRQPRTESNLDETRRDETRRDETSARAEGEPDPNDPVELYHDLTSRTPSPKGAKWLDRLAAEHGGRATVDALAAEWTRSPFARDLISRTEDRLVLEARRAKAAAERKRAAPVNGKAKPTPEEIAEADHQRAVLAAELAKVKGMPA